MNNFSQIWDEIQAKHPIKINFSIQDISQTNNVNCQLFCTILKISSVTYTPDIKSGLNVIDDVIIIQSYIFVKFFMRFFILAYKLDF
jgi:hypothetical protein